MGVFWNECCSCEYSSLEIDITWLCLLCNRNWESSEISDPNWLKLMDSKRLRSSCGLKTRCRKSHSNAYDTMSFWKEFTSKDLKSNCTDSIRQALANNGLFKWLYATPLRYKMMARDCIMSFVMASTEISSLIIWSLTESSSKSSNASVHLCNWIYRNASETHVRTAHCPASILQSRLIDKSCWWANSFSALV